MSPNCLLLLSLLFLGATADDGSEIYVESFVDALKGTIEIKNEDYLNEIISDDFVFYGCKKQYNKKEVLAMIRFIPPNAPVAVTFKSSRFIVKYTVIEYTVSVKGFGVSIEPTFIIGSVSGRWKLVAVGIYPNCPKSAVRSLSNSAEDIAKSFVESLKNEAQDEAKLAKRISDKFVFHGCLADYDKKKTIEAFSKPDELSLNFKSARFVNGEDIEYLVELIRHGVPHDGQFVLHKENGEYVLIGGKVTNCPARRLRFLAASPAAIHIANDFVRRLESLNSADKLAPLFSDTLVVHTCSGIMNKAELLQILSMVPPEVLADKKVTILSAEFVAGSAVKCVVQEKLAGVTAKGEYVLTLENGFYVASSGRQLDC